jgi:hypothetical protein
MMEVSGGKQDSRTRPLCSFCIVKGRLKDAVVSFFSIAKNTERDV